MDGPVIEVLKLLGRFALQMLLLLPVMILKSLLELCCCFHAADELYEWWINL